LPPVALLVLPPVFPEVAVVSPLVPPVALASPLVPLEEVLLASPPAQLHPCPCVTSPPVEELSLVAVESELALGAPEVAEPPAPLFEAVLLAEDDPPLLELLALLPLLALPEPEVS